MDGYRSAQWKRFRDEVIRLDGSACTVCGKDVEHGAVLHVHHKRYLPGHKPWQYAHAECETLCAGCHAAEHGVIPPRFGWGFAGYEDLGDLDGECEYCGTSIRHVFLIHHPKWRALEVGEDCCDNLTATQLASNHMESLRRQLDRRKRFVSSTRWKADRKGVHRIKQERIYLELVPEGESFRLRVNGKLGKKVFASLIDGKASAFDLMDSGAIQEYVEKHRLGFR